MYTLRRLRVQNLTTLRRGNAVLQTTPSAPAPPPPPPPSVNAETTPEIVSEDIDAPQTQGRRRPRKREPIPPKRPDISAEKPRKWNRALAEGVLPAYDLALQVIKIDGVRLGHEADAVRKELEELEAKVAQLGRWSEVELEVEEARKRLRSLEVQSQVNSPEVRWRVANAMVDMTKPVHRHLVEQRWRSDGDLDLLMERLYQMKVIPDVLPDLHPTIDIHVSARTTYKDMKVTGKKHFTVEPGTFLLPEQTLEPPNLHANVFHTDTRLYTLLLVDPDVPSEEIESFSTFLHWLKPNVPLSATQRTAIKGLNDHTPYIPPHPQRGTRYHRYVLLMLPQPPLPGTTYNLTNEARATPGVSTSVSLDIPPVDATERRNFDVRAFVQKWGLDGVKGGAHMWREVWNEKVSKIYRNTLQEPEPRYGVRPKADRYAESKRTKRYV